MHCSSFVRQHREAFERIVECPMVNAAVLVLHWAMPILNWLVKFKISRHVLVRVRRRSSVYFFWSMHYCTLVETRHDGTKVQRLLWRRSWIRSKCPSVSDRTKMIAARNWVEMPIRIIRMVKEWIELVSSIYSNRNDELICIKNEGYQSVIQNDLAIEQKLLRQFRSMGNREELTSRKFRPCSWRIEQVALQKER